MKYTANQFEEILNDLGIPKYDKLSKGGSIPDKANYGTWLKENNPDQFNKGLQEANSRTKEIETQQVEVMVKMNFVVGTELSKEEIKEQLTDQVHICMLSNPTCLPSHYTNSEITGIKEEAEIYGND